MTDDLQPDDAAAGSAEAVPDLPDDPQEAVSMLTDALTVARADAASVTDDLQRIAAEFENFRKRSVRDRDEIMRRPSGKIISTPSTWLAVTPYLRQCGPPAFSPTLPPRVQTFWLAGSGA